MSCLLVEFSASGGKFTVINCGQDGGNQEGSGAKDTFGFKVVVFVADDLANSICYNLCFLSSDDVLPAK